MISKTEYVYVPQVWLGALSDATFIGTLNYLFAFTTKSIKIEWEAYEEHTTFSFNGEPIQGTIEGLLETLDSVAKLEFYLLELAEKYKGEVVHYKLEELKSFKVQANFFGSGIHVIEANKKFVTPFVTKFGEMKNEVKAFYASHPKRK